MKSETVKTLLIFVLFGMTLFLLRGLWVDDYTMAGPNTSYAQVDIGEDVAFLLEPKAVNCSFGGGQITAFFYDKNDVFEGLRPSIASGLMTSIEEVEVQASTYFKARKNKSIEFIMPFRYEVRDFLSLVNTSNDAYVGKVTHIEKILMVAREPSYFYIFDGESYIQVFVEDGVTDVVTFVDEIEKEINKSMPYLTVEERFPLPLNEEGALRPSEYVLIPVFHVPPIQVIEVAKELDASDDNQVQSLAVNTFGARLNFVQEVVDINNSILLLYGYGDRALRLLPNGRIEYTEKIDTQVKSESDFSSDLRVGLNFAARLGGRVSELYLRNVVPLTQDNAKGYRFEFSYRINALQVISEDDQPTLVVEVFGGRVRKLSRNMKAYVKMVPVTSVGIDSKSINDEQFFNMLNNQSNFDVMFANYVTDNAIDLSTISPLERYTLLLHAIQDFSIVYLENGKDRLIPVFALTLDQRTYYLDFYTYRIMKIK